MKLDEEIESIRRIQGYARRTIKIESTPFTLTIEAIVLRDLIWGGCTESGAFGELNPVTRQKMLSATLKELAESKTNQWLTPRNSD